MTTNGYHPALITKEPPHSLEAEQAVLGAIMTDPSAFVQIAAYLTPRDFFLVRHAFIFQAIERLTKRGDAIDALTVCDELSRIGQLEEIGGALYITDLLLNTVTTTNADVYGKLVHRAATRRRLMVAADEIRALALDEEKEVETVIRESQSSLLDVTGRIMEQRGETVRGLMHTVMDEVEARMESGDKVFGIPTGLEVLDSLIDGLEPERFYLLAGRPRMGKSAMALCIALNAAKQGYRVGVFPNEMSKREFGYRMASIESGIPTRYLKRAGLLNKTQYSRYVEATAAISNLPIYIDDGRYTPSQIESNALWLMRTMGLDLLILDGAYRMPSNTAHTDRYDRYSEVAEDLKGLSRSLHIPVVATHQLNRELEKRADKRPILSDLAESGRFEQEADVILFLHREVVYNANFEFPNQADVICAKNRDGQEGVATVYFDKSITKFVNGTTRQVDLRDGTKD